jgi:hypothetical protein
MILIPEIDRRIRILTRGMLGMVLAQYKVGKSVALVWIARAYALQGLNVLFFTLEDPQELVEDRLDALITDIDMKLMPRKSDVVRRRFRERRDDLHGRIKIVDGTEGGMSVAMMEQIWERERDRGFDADAIIIDYDDEIEPPVAYKNREIYRRFEFADIYRELRRWAARRQLIIWTAAQAKRGKGEDQKVVAGEDTAEDIQGAKSSSLPGPGYVQAAGLGERALPVRGRAQMGRTENRLRHRRQLCSGCALRWRRHPGEDESLSGQEAAAVKQAQETVR